MNGIIYGSTTGNTENAANKIAEVLGNCEVKSIAEVTVAELESYDFLILGTSTWGAGDLQDDWEDGIDKIKDANLSASKVALFGMGDQEGFGDTYLDAMKIVADVVSDKGLEIVGKWSTDGYSFSDSASVDGDMFIGLALDDDNEADMTDERIEKWCEDIKGEM